MDEVKVEYIGPGKEDDPRVLTVSAEEADELVKTGLWRAKRSTKAEEKKED